MARQIVFLVHGVGDQKAGWTKALLKQLDKIGQRYPTVDGVVSDQIEFVEIVYGAIFDDQLKRWDDDVNKLKAEGVVPQAGEALAWLDTATEGSFVWTHIGDVVLFLSNITRMAVVSDVAAQMAAVIADKDDGDTEFSIVAHSLGTAVTMEAVNALRTPNPDKKWPGLPAKFRFREVMMVSNTSRLLQRDGLRAYVESTMLPAKFKNGGVCLTYRNIYHRRDPISWVRRFDLEAPDNVGYVRSVVEHYHARNIHGLSHYLEHPALHGPLIRLVDPAYLPAKALRDAMSEYQSTSGSRFGGEFSKLEEVVAFEGELDVPARPNPESETELVGQLKYIVDLMRRML